MKTIGIHAPALLLPALAVAAMTSCGGPKKKAAAIENNGAVAVEAPAKSETAADDTLSVAIVGKPENGRGFILEVKKGGKEVQQLHYSYDFDDYGTPNFPLVKDSLILCDVTSDGRKDLLVYMGSYGNQGIERFDCYVWDEKSRKLQHVPSFIDIDNPTVDKAEGCVFSSARSSAAEYVYAKWQYKDGEFRKKAELVAHYNTVPEGDFVYAEKDSAGRVVKENLKRSEVSACWKALVEE